MNKVQKEIAKAQLQSEEKTLNELRAVYNQAKKDVQAKISALNARQDMQNLQSIIYQKKYQETLLKEIDKALYYLLDIDATLEGFFKESYNNGYLGTMYDIQSQGIPVIMPIDPKAVERALINESKLVKRYYETEDPIKGRVKEDFERLKNRVRSNISRGIASDKNWIDVATDIAKGMNNPFDIAFRDTMRIVRTEGHRIQQQGHLDAGDNAVAVGAEIVKQWDASLDSRTRPVHQMADGQIVEWDEDFVVGGEKLKAPGIGGSAWNVINCRCQLLQRAKWALDEDELETLKERAKFFDLDKSDSFEDFKKKYLKLPEDADKMELVAPSFTSVKKTIGGLECWVDQVESYGFGDGRGGIKKEVPATIYTTPDGAKFVYPKKYDKRKQTLSPEDAIRVWGKVPENIRSRIQKEIQVVDYYNPQDSYWRKTYKNFGHSYATGGDEITFYRCDDHNMNYLLTTYCHEGGHYIDYTIDGCDRLNRYCEQADWQNAMKADLDASGKKSYRAYGENSPLEDFADSVAYYITDNENFKTIFPERSKLLEKILK